MSIDGIQNDGYRGPMDPMTGANQFNAMSFLVTQIINKKWTLTLGLVKKVTGAAPDTVTVDVQPMVNQLDGYGQATPHGTIYKLPTLRLQGGTAAVLIDPKEGDIGLMACASRDISSVVANKAPANPGSGRTFDPADGIYLGSLLGAAPTQYVQITENKLSIVFSDTVKIELSESGAVITVGSVTFNLSSSEAVVTVGGSTLNISSGSIAIASAAITLNGIDWSTHTHAVTTAPGITGPPV